MTPISMEPNSERKDVSYKVMFVFETDIKQGICQLSESGEARLQIMLKVGGLNQRFMAIISDFGQNLAKVGGQ